MSIRTATDAPRVVDYPDSDGRPMSDNTLQFEWIVTIKSGLDAVFRDDPNVFVAGDLLWYPIEGDNKTRKAPDAMVAFGRPKGYRGSYMQWVEEGIAPKVAFEVLSPKNRRREMERKRMWYFHFGVEEYYEFDPYKVRLRGWVRDRGVIREVEPISGWTSPSLGVRFEIDGDLTLIAPDGRPIETYLELSRLRDEADLRATAERRRAEAERRRAEQQSRIAEQQSRIAEEQGRIAEEQSQIADEQRRRADRLAARLRELGLGPEE